MLPRAAAGRGLRARGCCHPGMYPVTLLCCCAAATPHQAPAGKGCLPPTPPTKTRGHIHTPACAMLFSPRGGPRRAFPPHPPLPQASAAAAAHRGRRRTRGRMRCPLQRSTAPLTPLHMEDKTCYAIPPPAPRHPAGARPDRGHPMCTPPHTHSNIPPPCASVTVTPPFVTRGHTRAEQQASKAAARRPPEGLVRPYNEYSPPSGQLNMMLIMVERPTPQPCTSVLQVGVLVLQAHSSRQPP